MREPGIDDSAAVQILRKVFGYDEFRGEQGEIIEHVVGGGDALVLMPTGGGKSLCYQIPALVRPGTGVVISPLIALMQDQVDALLALGVRAGFLNSTQDFEQRRDIERAFLNGERLTVQGGPPLAEALVGVSFQPNPRRACPISEIHRTLPHRPQSKSAS